MKVLSPRFEAYFSHLIRPGMLVPELSTSTILLAQNLRGGGSPITSLRGHLSLNGELMLVTDWQLSWFDSKYRVQCEDAIGVQREYACHLFKQAKENIKDSCLLLEMLWLISFKETRHTPGLKLPLLFMMQHVPTS